MLCKIALKVADLIALTRIGAERAFQRRKGKHQQSIYHADLQETGNNIKLVICINKKATYKIHKCNIDNSTLLKEKHFLNVI